MHSIPSTLSWLCLSTITQSTPAAFAARASFGLSADQGDTDACLCLGGILYERGDYEGAEGYFTDAALKGEVKAMYNLGLMYSEGSLGEPDTGKAEEWFESAAQEGFAYAQTSLAGILYGRGDVEGAARWYRKAADQGEPTAMYNLGAFGISGMMGTTSERSGSPA